MRDINSMSSQDFLRERGPRAGSLYAFKNEQGYDLVSSGDGTGRVDEWVGFRIGVDSLVIDTYDGFSLVSSATLGTNDTRYLTNLLERKVRR